MKLGQAPAATILLQQDKFSIRAVSQGRKLILFMGGIKAFYWLVTFFISATYAVEI
jgi:hypothetical protein